MISATPLTSNPPELSLHIDPLIQAQMSTPSKLQEAPDEDDIPQADSMNLCKEMIKTLREINEKLDGEFCVTNSLDKDKEREVDLGEPLFRWYEIRKQLPAPLIRSM